MANIPEFQMIEGKRWKTKDRAHLPKSEQFDIDSLSISPYVRFHGYSQDLFLFCRFERVFLFDPVRPPRHLARIPNY